MTVPGHFLQRFACKNQKDVKDFDQAALHLLMAHSWPGHMRELKNDIERAVVLAPGRTITADLIMVGGRELPRRREYRTCPPIVPSKT